MILLIYHYLKYFKSDARRTKTSPDWFKRKIKKAEEMLSVKNDYSTNEDSVLPLVILNHD